MEVSGRTAAALLDEVATGRIDGERARLTPLPTGFDPLDKVLGGGLRAQDLAVLGGRPGVGKTVAALQWARHLAQQGHTAIYVCYEHSELTLLGRLLALELGTLARPDEVPALDRLRALARDLVLGAPTLGELAATPLGEEAYGRLAAYAERLWLVRASGATTGPRELEVLVDRHARDGTVLFVDYLQKVAVSPDVPDDERVTRVAETLKELAMSRSVAVVGIAAADRPGLTSRRLRLHQLRGSAGLAHEADVVIVLNEKWGAVAKAHLSFNPVRAETFRHFVVFSIEKNRDGPAPMDLEFRKDFESYRFEPAGGFVGETLVDDVLFEE
ncbi:MAG: DnaB helicase C-terminal domain-containing protein [Acidimicrobiia bacterium]|nr:DnaB helicase C-terminal domain-containing protein [Acidimicrobiia bacterium]